MSEMTVESKRYESHLFLLALGMSALMHLIVLASLFYANMRYDEPITTPTQIVYETSQPVGQVHLVPQKAIESVRAPNWGRPNIFPNNPDNVLGEIKEVDKGPAQVALDGKQFVRIPDLVRKRQVTVPVLESDKITNPRYLNYHEQIREKIRNRAYYYADGPGFETGKVYLTFVLLSNGTLKKIRIDNTRTHANAFLRTVGLRSIKDSSPFPPFPAGLNYPELSFNILISFEVTK